MGVLFGRIGSFLLSAFTGMGILDFLGFGRSDDDNDTQNAVMVVLGIVVVVLGGCVYKLKKRKNR